MRFLIDRCAGTSIATWLRDQDHDVVETRERGADPGDRVLLEWAEQESRIPSLSTPILANSFFLKVSPTAA